MKNQQYYTGNVDLIANVTHKEHTKAIIKAPTCVGAFNKFSCLTNCCNDCIIPNRNKAYGGLWCTRRSVLAHYTTIDTGNSIGQES